MLRRLQAISALTFLLLLQGCQEPVPTVPSTPPPPTHSGDAAGAPGVAPRPANNGSTPDPTTPKAL
jgi:hypothetical protein